MKQKKVIAALVLLLFFLVILLNLTFADEASYTRGEPSQEYCKDHNCWNIKCDSGSKICVEQRFCKD